MPSNPTRHTLRRLTKEKDNTEYFKKLEIEKIKEKSNLTTEIKDADQEKSNLKEP
jgi:FtsZ-binding cell division protein ZapB